MNIRFAKSVQNYTFLRTQQNKMHKIALNVHNLNILCNLCGETLGRIEKMYYLCRCFMSYNRYEERISRADDGGGQDEKGAAGVWKYEW
ncbi:MAG: hypothetical protein J6M23_09670 [Bacteroidales bacterium]|nr:hypothetical protein [Bacteroidales bacterium]